MKNQEKMPLIIGLIIPVLMVIFIAASIFVPRLFAPPVQYDFIYSVPDGYNPDSEYWVREGRIQLRDIKDLNQKQTHWAPVRLYRYHVKENRNAQITMEEAKNLSLSDNSQSPDGYEIGPGTQGSSFLFFYSSYSDYSAMYLKGHGVAHKLNLTKGKREYYSDFHFIGWVLS